MKRNLHAGKRYSGGFSLDTLSDDELHFIQPGRPVRNAFIESFNGKFRDECLNSNWFVSLTDAERRIEAWRCDYNGHRPHSSLGNLTPEEFARRAA